VSEQSVFLSHWICRNAARIEPDICHSEPGRRIDGAQ